MNRKINWTVLLSIGLIILMIINIIALITIISLNKKKQVVSREERPHFHEFMNNELNLTDQQKDTFFKLRHEFMMDGKKYLDLIQNYRDSVFNELMNAHPDTILINHYNDQIEYFHSKMIRLSYQHFLTMKEILDSNQQRKYFMFLNDKMRVKFRGMKYKKGCCENEAGPPPPFPNMDF